MKLKIILIINAVVAILYGLALLLFPVWMGALYGFTADEPLIFTARLLGVYLFATGVLSWLIRDAPASDTLKNVVLAFFSMDVLGLVVSLIAQLRGTLNAQGWSLVAIYLLLGIGFGYYLLAKPKAS